MTIARYSLMAVATAVALTACQKQDAAQNAASEPAASSAAAAGEVIKIGVAGPLTGPLAHIGKDTEFGVRMAADDVNAAGGLDLGGKKFKIEIGFINVSPVISIPTSGKVLKKVSSTSPISVLQLIYLVV